MCKLHTRRTTRLERCSTDEELIRENTKCPVIDTLCVRFSFYHFRRQIVESPAERCPAETQREELALINKEDTKEKAMTYRLPGA